MLLVGNDGYFLGATFHYYYLGAISSNPTLHSLVVGITHHFLLPISSISALHSLVIILEGITHH